MKGKIPKPRFVKRGFFHDPFQVATHLPFLKMQEGRSIPKSTEVFCPEIIKEHSQFKQHGVDEIHLK